MTTNEISRSAENNFADFKHVFNCKGDMFIRQARLITRPVLKPQYGDTSVQQTEN